MFSRLKRRSHISSGSFGSLAGKSSLGFLSKVDCWRYFGNAQIYTYQSADEDTYLSHTFFQNTPFLLPTIQTKPNISA